jgi:hypothetical protein
MSNAKIQINFDAPAVLRKWPSIRNERVSVSDGGCPYQIAEGSLNDCIRQFMAKPASQHHLYEIHTASQGGTIIPVLSAKHILEIAPLRYFL